MFKRLSLELTVQRQPLDLMMDLFPRDLKVYPTRKWQEYILANQGHQFPWG